MNAHRPAEQAARQAEDCNRKERSEARVDDLEYEQRLHAGQLMQLGGQDGQAQHRAVGVVGCEKCQMPVVTVCVIE